jgi:hypothetical protein
MRDMKLLELESLASEPHIEDDLASRVGALFERCPALQGFSIQDAAGLPKHLQAAALEGLIVTDIGIYPELEPALTERVYDEIAVGLLDFICSRPDARAVLTGRTFVGTCTNAVSVRQAHVILPAGSRPVTLPDPR